ncbi:efflux transporter outer membrane subunit [Sphingomonas gei]|uniref:Efflux transporter outer membrane subunit n=1 Tax=Sphingomonas gei TaxID=1395960 RepID=A0A4S1XID8_9SPHN|nr:efflux transporter outer membrane subunit [Sphingomonas gei]TGX55757.1 efflux transporter outer membrane subunit [Sphingomonas gei]
MLLPFALIGGCTLQPAYQRPALDLPAEWNNAPDGAAQQAAIEREGWWALLGDPAVDRLVAAGLRDNPTLGEAAARVDQARAAANAENARRMPSVGATANLSGAKDRAGSGTATVAQASADIGANLAWELDLWGRLRETATAARHRLTARTADAEAARLSIVAEIADTALALRACNLVHGIRERDIASREVEAKIIRARLAFGYVAPVAAATAQSNLASARTERIAQAESCRLLADALVALSGLDLATVLQLLPRETPTQGDMRMPEPPPFAPALPATILLRHPGVVAAEREVAARWSEIAVARAQRLPRIDLTALLTGQWLRALGSSDSYVSGSIGAGLTAPLFDGGAGAANVRLAEARYREAVAQLVFALRTAVRDIEDALAAQQSAAARIETSSEALAAARFTLSASEARWRAGSIAQLELEEARRQSNRAQESAVGAAADRARAWVALVRRTGTAWQAPPIGPGSGNTPAGEIDSGSGNVR